MTDKQAPSELPGYGYRSEQEHRLPATIAILLSAVIYSLLPAKLIFGPRYVLPVLELIILIPIVISNPMKITKESRNLRGLSLLMIGLKLIICSGDRLGLQRLAGTIDFDRFMHAPGE